MQSTFFNSGSHYPIYVLCLSSPGLQLQGTPTLYPYLCGTNKYHELMGYVFDEAVYDETVK